MEIVGYIKFIVNVENAPHHIITLNDLPDVNTYAREKACRTYCFIFRH